MIHTSSPAYLKALKMWRGNAGDDVTSPANRQDFQDIGRPDLFRKRQADDCGRRVSAPSDVRS